MAFLIYAVIALIAIAGFMHYSYACLYASCLSYHSSTSLRQIRI